MNTARRRAPSAAFGWRHARRAPDRARDSPSPSSARSRRSGCRRASDPPRSADRPPRHWPNGVADGPPAEHVADAIEIELRFVAAGVRLVGQLARGARRRRPATGRSRAAATTDPRHAASAVEQAVEDARAPPAWRAGRCCLPGPTHDGQPDSHGTAGDQLARALEQRQVHVEQRPAEADAARIVVVDEDVRLGGERVRRRRRSRRSAPTARARRRRPTARCRGRRTSAAAARCSSSRTPARPRRRARRRRRTAATPSPPAGSSASTTTCASAAPADRARPTRRSRWCRT